MQTISGIKHRSVHRSVHNSVHGSLAGVMTLFWIDVYD